MSDLAWVSSDGRAVCCGSQAEGDCASEYAAFDLGIAGTWYGHSACGNPAHMAFVLDMPSVHEHLQRAAS